MNTTQHVLIGIMVFALLMPGQSGGQRASANERPVADAGPLRYAGAQAVQLDGSRSHDPDQSGPLTYAWKQTAGPLLVLTGADTAAPTINGPGRTNDRGMTTPGVIPQTESIQECQFELVVSDGELTSLPDTVKMLIVPFYGAEAPSLQNPPFDVNRPTFIYFGGGDCVTGSAGQTWAGSDWAEKANLIGFRSGYSPDGGGGARTYYKYADMLIVYLSSVAPDYRQPIQTSGWSTGGQPAIDVGLRLNLTYMDPRYAINRVTFFDATPYCRATYQESIRDFLASSVDGEQCWIDNYVGQNVHVVFPGILNFGSALTHAGVPNWYSTSLIVPDACGFSHGLVAGAYWSVIGPGKNLQLAFTPQQQIYNFTWIGDPTAGFMELSDESLHPGRLPEPVTLGAWVNKSAASGEIDGAVLSCRYSENAVRYELLFGSDPDHVMNYKVVSDTPAPPLEILRDLPSSPTWWTVRVRDRHGSTIYADPIRLDLAGLPPLSIENARTGKKYGLLSHATGDAASGDVLLLDPGIYEESIEFGDKTLALRSLDPGNPDIVVATIIRGNKGMAAVAYSGRESAGCTLDGLTIQGSTVGVSCRDAAPTIRNCVLDCPQGIALEYWHAQTPTLIDCTILGQVKEGGDPGLVAYWKLDETEGVTAFDSEGIHDATVIGGALWQAEGQMQGALQLDGADDYLAAATPVNPRTGPFSVFAWVKGGGPGQVILSQTQGANWLRAAPVAGTLGTELNEPGRNAAQHLQSDAVITDGAWHRVGLVWDGAGRTLYVDDVEVARGTLGKLPDSIAGLQIGAGSALAPGTFWSGLIDDVRIYNRVVQP